MRNRKPIAAIFLAMATLVLAGASSPLLLAPDAIDVVRLLPDPPPPQSQEGQAEMQEMVQLQRTRIHADEVRIDEEASFHVTLFDSVLGPHFNAQDCPRAFELVSEVAMTADHFCDEGKAHWKRRRPPLVFPQIQPCLPTPHSASYPSGHSTLSMACAEVLAALLPEKRAELLERGRQIGWDRVMAGVHYPSDVEAGRVLGHVVAEEILASPGFKTQEAAARAELEKIEAAAVH
ncbi:MAG TPA: phosphatase PAP2 family protein [Tepidisphaeraceae bacterium]|nr:phosphatase PAP2 family protein [Tepidisphaeraceae bacterium]